MSNREQKMLAALNNSVDHYDHADAAVVAPGVSSTPNPLSVTKMKGNPAFVAQFDIQLLLYYFTVAAGVYTATTAAALNAALKTQIPAFLFGQGDFASGFRRAKGQFPLSGGWAYGAPFVYGAQGYDSAGTSFGVLDATARAVLRDGDMVVPVTATVGGVNYVGLSVVRCNSVGYGTLLASTSSDRFWLNNIRYVIADASQLAQYNNDIKIQNQSLFGKYSEDSVSPNSFKQPEQYQNGIIDVAIKKGIDKNTVVGTWIDYTSVAQLWSIFVSTLDKLAA